jgi:hypothetical protein
VRLFDPAADPEREPDAQPDAAMEAVLAEIVRLQDTLHCGFRALGRASARNGAYPRVRIRCRRLPARQCEGPASRHIRGVRLLEPGLIAMQKVEGSNPFSRFPSTHHLDDSP